VFTGLALSLLLAALDQSAAAAALPTIVTELGGLTHIAWLVTAYLTARRSPRPNRARQACSAPR
jgi:hypothetical protein